MKTIKVTSIIVLLIGCFSHVSAQLCGNAQASFTIMQNGPTTVLQSNSTAVPSGGLYQWWVDGNAVTSPNPNNAYTLSNLPVGYHSFCLYVFADANTFCDSTCRGENINNGNNSCDSINAEFTQTYNTGGSVHFVGVPNQFSVTHYWNFGDGTTSTLAEPTHCYANGGLYNITHVVELSGVGCIDSISHQVQANACVDSCAGFSVSIDTMSSPNGHFMQANIADPSSHAPYSYAWNTGGATTQIIQAAPGTSCVTVTNSIGCTATDCETVPLCAGFSVEIIASHGATGDTLKAYVISGSAVTYQWSNGSWSGGYIINPTPGVYCVTATDINGCTAYACHTVEYSCVSYRTDVVTACDSFTWINGITYLSSNNSATYTYTNGNVSGCDSIVTLNLTLNNAYFSQHHNCNSVYFVSQPQVTGWHYLWNFGDGTTDSIANPTHVFPAGQWTVVLTIDNGQCTSSFTAVVPVPITPCDTICGVVFNDANSNGIMDNNEVGLPNVVVYAGNYSVHTDSSGHYSIIAPGGSGFNVLTYLPSGCVRTLPLNSNPLNGGSSSYYIPDSLHGGCGYNFGFNCSVVNICGTVYFDSNNNHTHENNEAGIGNVHVTLTSTGGLVYHAYTNSNGFYQITVPSGTYSITVPSNIYAGGAVTPTSTTVNATTAGNTYCGNDFGVYVQPGYCDLAVEIHPGTTVTAGRPAWYYVRVRNVGGSVSGGTLDFMYDPVLTYHSSSPVGTNNAGTYTVSWAVAPLAPATYRDYFVRFDASTQLTIGQLTAEAANITPDGSCVNDVNPNNNIDTVHQGVTGSWDPNNKLAYKTNHATNTDYQWISSLNTDQRLEYVINFQNEGNGPAINVVVKNVVTPDLDLNSFELLGMSHVGQLVQNGSELNFKFSDIMLAPKETDEPNSKGWVRYAINAVNALPAGHIIAEPADIYFDYNEAVTTNDGAVILLDATGIGEVLEAATVVVAPNPMSDYTRITLNNSQADNFRFRVIDITGRVISDDSLSGNTLMFNRNLLASGLYVYQVVQKNKVVATGKLIMQ